MATEKIWEYSMTALPYLVHYAQTRQLVTYGELAEQVGCHHRVVGRILGCLRDEICIPKNKPLINAIVVNAETNQPGESWLPESTSHLSEEEYQHEFEKFRDEVFAFQGWGDLLKEFGLRPVRPEPKDLDARGRAYSGYLERQENGSLGEGESHNLLKEFIAAHPEEIGVTPISPAETEYLFISGDRCDVIFDLGEDGYVVIEIKNGNPGELVKGIYQAVKYRALMQAEKGHGSPVLVDAVLVAYTIPSEITMFAAKLGVRCHIVRKETIKRTGE